MSWFNGLFDFRSEDDRLNDCYHSNQQWTALNHALARETPEQKARFYLEVAALLGNKSAAERLQEMDRPTSRSLAED